MSEYKRLYQPGGNYFFTLVTHKRCSIFSDPKNVLHFKNALRKVKKKYPFYLIAIVIMPDHLHCLWNMPEHDHDFSTRWRLIKRFFSIEINQSDDEKIWQRRFWEHLIRNERDWQAHMNYIHYNPVKHGLVKSPRDWEYSSFHHWVEKGMYEENWGSSGEIDFSGIHEAE